MTREIEPCALCAEFSMKADPELAKEGKGMCRPREEVHHYSDRACVLYGRPADLVRRREWLEKQTQVVEAKPQSNKGN